MCLYGVYLIIKTSKGGEMEMKKLRIELEFTKFVIWFAIRFK